MSQCECIRLNNNVAQNVKNKVFFNFKVQTNVQVCQFDGDILYKALISLKLHSLMLETIVYVSVERAALSSLYTIQLRLPLLPLFPRNLTVQKT